MRTHPRLALLIVGGLAVPAPLPAQAPKPLDKIEIVRLLTNPLFAQAEVAEVVRRSCVSFRPTERDWTDLRNAGASGEVIASVAACTSRRAEPAPAPPAPPPAPITAVAVTPEILARVGTPSLARVFVHRGGVPQRRVAVTLRGSTAIGFQRDALATTDDSGMAVFPLPPVGQPGVHRFDVVASGNSTFAGRPAINLVVRSGEPGRLRVTPDFIASVENGATILATVTDSLGNPLPREPVELSSGVGPAQSVPTDSMGRASFTMAPSALPRGGALQLRVRKLAAVEVPVADVAGLSGVLTGFVGPASRRGRVGSAWSEPVLFRARTVQGTVPTGRVVRFRAVNARVKPDSAVLDSTGTVALELGLGARVGDVLVFASIDSVEKLLTLHADPGPIATLVVDYLGETTTGREISVRVARPFVLRVTARDLYGNETSIEPLAQLLRSGRTQQASRQPNELEIVSLDFNDDAVLVTLKAPKMQTYEFTIGSGITATVRVRALLM
ncbi:MAG TPA: Ig-like domain-containing protein [Gemmatimonadales bacterium]|nr:Ig-like domain-containing protein [Gemmatimonadales bacterium]